MALSPRASFSHEFYFNFSISYTHFFDYNFFSASSSFSFTGNLNVLAFLGGVFFILISLGIFITVVCFAGHKRRNRRNSVRSNSGGDKKRGMNFLMFILYKLHCIERESV